MFGKAFKATFGVGCAIVVGLIALAVISGALVNSSGQIRNVIASVSPQAANANSTPRLALLSSSCKTEFGYDTCSGEVKNISSESIKNVTAVTTWRDSAGAAQRTDSALIEFNPILAGQTSPFKTIGSTNPGLTKADVRFKELLGGEITTRDDRNK